MSTIALNAKMAATGAPLAEAQTLSDHMALAASEAPDARHVILGETEIAYSHAWAAAKRMAQQFGKMGLAPRDRVLLCLPNHPAMAILCTAIWLASGIVTTASALDTDATLKFKLSDSGARLVITGSDPGLSARVEAVCGDDAQSMTIDALLPLVHSEEPMPEADDAVFKSSPGDIALLQYTGGTTGEPKAAMLTHANFIANGRQMLGTLDGFVYGNERFLLAAPASHITGMSSIMLGLSVAAELVFVPRFNPAEAIELIVQQQLTYLIGVPTMYNAMLHEGVGSAENWRSLKYALVGGAPVTPTLAESFLTQTGCRLLSGYGLSETSPAVTLMSPASSAPPGSTGTPVADTIVEIRSLENPYILMPQGEAGEVCVGGPQVTSGYWNRPDVTDSAFVGGLFRTGDIGFLDEVGHLHLVDRLKDMIIASGFNVYPARVEEAIYRHPDVREVAVIGAADEYRGETVKAVIALRSNASLTLEALQAFLKGDLSPVEMPKRLEIVDELPKSSAGKILRRAVRT